MPPTVVVLSGSVSSGKSTLARKIVDQYGATRISTRELLLGQSKHSESPNRSALQKVGDALDRQTGGEWLAEAVVGTANSLEADAIIVVDSARILAQIEGLRIAFGRRVVHLHLQAPPDVISARYEGRRGSSNLVEMSSYSEVRENPTEAAIDQLAEHADVVIDTARCTAEDVFTRAASHLGLTSRSNRLVDVIVGGQYGSEGKGHIVFHISPEYQMLVRVGGPNAGHQVIGSNREIFTHRQLPSGTRACDATLAIGAGAVINVDVLLREIADCSVDVERLAIDPRAMIISPADRREEERHLVSAIGSTGQGGGAALARRIRYRYRGVKLAQNVPALRPYTRRPVIELLEEAYSRGERVLLEGTQGTGLSLYHGDYPHVTSRDTTAAGCLAEAGVAPSRVRRVIMVCRTYPIRVMSPSGSSSGSIGLELDWATIAKRSGLDKKETEEAEKGSVSHNVRRVAEFDWEQLRRSALLNGTTDIALTFVDYLRKENREARRFDQLTEDTIYFIEEVERVARAPVTLISTRFHPRSIIDRRRW